MARLGKKKISRRTVDALEVERDTIFWDSELAGFGVRVHPTGRKVYIAQTRADGKAAKRVTVGRHGVITADEARRRAALIVSRIKAGEEAIPEPMAAKLAGGPTVGELAERWLEKHVAVRCKPKTESMYRLVVAKYILPAFGRRPALALGCSGTLALIDLRGDGPVRMDAPSAVAHDGNHCGRPHPVGGRPCRCAGGGRISVRVAVHRGCLRGRVRPGLRQAEGARGRRACRTRGISGWPRRLRYRAHVAAGVAGTGKRNWR